MDMSETSLKLKRKNILFLLSALLSFQLFLSGCIKKLEPISSYLAPSQVNYLEERYTSVNNCTVMICKYPSLFDRWWSSIQNLFDSSGYVSLKNMECNFTKLNLDNSGDLDYVNKLTGRKGSTPSSEFIQPVMLGIGDSVFAGDDLFATCSGNLGINLIDVSSFLGKIGNEKIKSRFEGVNDCILKSGTIPFYKFDKIRSGESILPFLDIIKGSGPVFVSPGYEYSRGSYQSVTPPIGFFSTIKSNCKNCIVTATVKYGDFETVNDYKSRAGDWESIDVIAFTANLSSFSSCEPFVVIHNETDSLKSFAQNITELYHKPVIIIVSGKEGNNSANTCKWTNETIARFYDYLIRSTSELASSGVIALIAPDIGQLSNQSYNSLGLLCTIYYSSDTPSYNFKVSAIFSEKGDVTSLCSDYNSPKTSMFIFGDVINYNDVKLAPTKKSESCYAKVFLDYTDSGGLFSINNCNISRLTVSNFASKYFLDTSLYMATLQKLGYYSGASGSSRLQSYEQHCTDRCNRYSGEDKDLCCVAETMSYYQSKTLEKQPTISDYNLAYLIAYGTLKGESQFNSEINRVYSSQSTQTFSSEKTSRVELQTSQCDVYKSNCEKYGDQFYCALYDFYCKSQLPEPTPTPIPTPSPSPKPSPVPSPTPSPGTSPTPSPSPSIQLDSSITQVLKDAFAARTICQLE